VTVNELCNRYWKHAENHYRDAEGRNTSDLFGIRSTIRVFRGQVGLQLAGIRSPALQACSEAMVKKGWLRSTVNQACDRVKRTIRWGVESELLPADRWQALRAVRGLIRGRTDAPEPDPIGPVDVATVHATSP
jgi:hypothetical protein